MRNPHTEKMYKQLKEILGSNFNAHYALAEDNEVITKCKVNTDVKLKMHMINALENMAESWGFTDMEISRSGAGLKIEFLEYEPAVC